MVLEHYIAELLYRYDCVVVPGFGAFLTQTRPSTIHKATHTLYPPSKTLSFNARVDSNDGLLVSYMAKAEKVTYETMRQNISLLVSEWKSRLENDERLKLADIGEFWCNEDGKIQFLPSQATNFLTSSFGFSSFPIAPVKREQLKNQVMALEEKVPLAFTPEKKRQPNLRPYLKYAAILLLAFATGITGFRSYVKAQNERQIAAQEAQEQVSKRIQEATFFNTEPMELSPLSLEVSVKNPASGLHHIIAGAFRYQKNAEKKISQLQAQGFEASYLGTNPFGLHMVAYGSYHDPKEALNALKRIRRTHSPDAWLKSIR